MNQSIIGELLEGIFDIKEKITDQEYRNLMESLHKLHKCDTPLGYIKDEHKENFNIYSVVNLEILETTYPCYRLNEDYVLLKKDEFEEAIHTHIGDVIEEITRAVNADELELNENNFEPADLNIEFLGDTSEDDPQ